MQKLPLSLLLKQITHQLMTEAQLTNRQRLRALLRLMPQRNLYKLQKHRRNLN
jgi:hypothetical protein